jgi:hypothetical protein
MQGEKLRKSNYSFHKPSAAPANGTACSRHGRKATLFLGSADTLQKTKDKRGSQMDVRKAQGFVVTGKEIFVGIEDSKRTWKIAVRSDKMVIDRTSMEAKYPILIRYLRNRFPEWRHSSDIRSPVSGS